MLTKVRIQTRDGVRELPFVPSAAALKAAADAGEVAVGDDIVYREWLVWLLEDYNMLILERLQVPNPVFGGGAGPEYAPPMGDAWRMFTPNMGNAQFSFTVNGVPVDPSQFMNGGNAGK